MLDLRHLTSAVATVTLILLALGSSSDEEDGKPKAYSPPPAPAPRQPNEIDAWVATKQFVRKSLKAPSTADFGSLFGESQDPKTACRAHGNQMWRCSGWVDSQNSFGAMIRTRFVAVVKTTGNDTWSLELLTTE